MTVTWLEVSSRETQPGRGGGGGLSACQSPTYRIVGLRFLNILAEEFQGVRAQTWNSERPLVFVAVVLQTMPGVKRARDIRRRLMHWMDLWYKGKLTALVDDTETEVQSRHGSHPVKDHESKARAFNSKVLSGRIRAASKFSTESAR
jgi:hypothetical protein